MASSSQYINSLKVPSAMPRSLLDNIVLDLIECLNIPNIRPYLRQARLLTDDELERLEITPANTTKDVVEALVTFLKRKGPGHERSFLLVLKESMKGDAHQGHAHIIKLLEEQLANADATENSLVENRMSSECHACTLRVLSAVPVCDSTGPRRMLCRVHLVYPLTEHCITMCMTLNSLISQVVSFCHWSSVQYSS